MSKKSETGVDFGEDLQKLMSQFDNVDITGAELSEALAFMDNPGLFNSMLWKKMILSSLKGDKDKLAGVMLLGFITGVHKQRDRALAALGDDSKASPAKKEAIKLLKEFKQFNSNKKVTNEISFINFASAFPEFGLMGSLMKFKEDSMMMLAGTYKDSEGAFGDKDTNISYTLPNCLAFPQACQLELMKVIKLEHKKWEGDYWMNVVQIKDKHSDEAKKTISKDNPTKKFKVLYYDTKSKDIYPLFFWKGLMMLKGPYDLQDIYWYYLNFAVKYLAFDLTRAHKQYLMTYAQKDKTKAYTNVDMVSDFNLYKAVEEAAYKETRIKIFRKEISKKKYAFDSKEAIEDRFAKFLVAQGKTEAEMDTWTLEVYGEDPLKTKAIYRDSRDGLFKPEVVPLADVTPKLTVL